MIGTLPSPIALRAFEAAARRLSFTNRTIRMEQVGVTGRTIITASTGASVALGSRFLCIDHLIGSVGLGKGVKQIFWLKRW